MTGTEARRKAEEFAEKETAVGAEQAKAYALIAIAAELREANSRARNRRTGWG